MTRTLIAAALLATVSTHALAQTQTAPAQTAPSQTTPPAPAGTMPQSGTATTGTAPAGTAPAGTATTGTATTGTATTGAAGTGAAAGANPTVGGVAMDATKPIPVNASAAPNLSTLVAAVKAAGLVDTLAGPGPFTVFAPTNDAFGRLAPGTVDTLLKPANKPSLVKVLTYHVVPGTITLADLQARLASGGGKTTLTTVEGGALVVTKEGNALSLTDTSGNKSYIETPDVRQSNGVVHVVNGVLVPKLG